MEIQKINIDNFEIREEIIDFKQEIQEKTIEPKIENLLNTKESNILVNELKEDILKNNNWHFDELLDFFEDIILNDFDDIDDREIDECEDELRKIKNIFWTSLNKTFLKNILYSLKNQKTNIEEKFPKKFKKNIVDWVYSFLEQKNEDESFLERNFWFIVYLQENRKLLDEIQKKLLNKWFQELLAYFKEWKVIEIYEIYVDENWNIIIKWKINGKNVTIVYNTKKKEFQDINWNKFLKIN